MCMCMSAVEFQNLTVGTQSPCRTILVQVDWSSVIQSVRIICGYEMRICNWCALAQHPFPNQAAELKAEERGLWCSCCSPIARIRNMNLSKRSRHLYCKAGPHCAHAADLNTMQSGCRILLTNLAGMLKVAQSSLRRSLRSAFHDAGANTVSTASGTNPQVCARGVS